MTHSKTKRGLIMTKLFSFSVIALTTLAVTATQGYCSKMYQVTGKVISTTNDTVTIQKGGDQFEFDRAQLKSGSKILKTGDDVTVFYNLDAKRAAAPEQAGEARTNELAPPDQNNVDVDVPLKNKTIHDDRIFLNAKNPQQQNDLPNG
jgi:hypothetical protein